MVHCQSVESNGDQIKIFSFNLKVKKRVLRLIFCVNKRLLKAYQYHKKVVTNGFNWNFEWFFMALETFSLKNKMKRIERLWWIFTRGLDTIDKSWGCVKRVFNTLHISFQINCSTFILFSIHWLILVVTTQLIKKTERKLINVQFSHS